MKKIFCLIPLVLFCSLSFSQTIKTSGTGSYMQRGSPLVDNGQGSFTVASSGTITGMVLSGNSTVYYEFVVANASTISGASSDIIAQNDISTATSNYVDLGINNSKGGTSPFTKGSDTYLYSSDTTLNLGAFGTGAQLAFTVAPSFALAGAATVTIGNTGTITIPTLKSTTGTRFICISTTGVLSSSASACSGT